MLLSCPSSIWYSDLLYVLMDEDLFSLHFPASKHTLKHQHVDGWYHFSVLNCFSIFTRIFFELGVQPTASSNTIENHGQWKKCFPILTNKIKININMCKTILYMKVVKRAIHFFSLTLFWGRLYIHGVWVFEFFIFTHCCGGKKKIQQCFHLPIAYSRTLIYPLLL